VSLSTLTAKSPAGAVPVSRTSPIAGDAHFTHLDAEINKLMAKYGFARKAQEGSTSWVATAKCPTVMMAGKTLFKLTYYGTGKPMRFGIRKDFAESHDRLRQISKWPVEFAVPPQQQVKFVGFEALDDTATVDRVQKVLNAFGAPKPENEIPLDGELAALDQQFEDLGL
jgi:hypothetical protein